MTQAATPSIVPIPSAPAKVVRQVSQGEILQEIAALRGATFISFVARTVPPMLKTANPFLGNCWKVANVHGLVNFQYAAGVLRRLVQEGKDASVFRQGESWHQTLFRADGTMVPYVQHKKFPKKLYLRFMFLRSLWYQYEDVEGRVLNTQAVHAFLPQRRQYANQGLRNPLQIKCYAVDGIQQITFNRITYFVR